MLNLMYITKHPEIARIAEEAGVDWIFVDMEFIGKDCRQGGLDTVQNHHTVEDVANIRAAVTKAKVLVRINPIHDTMDDYPSSEEEIEAVIQAGADIVMLPYFKTTEEVHRFIGYVGGRAKTCLLVETPEAADLLDQIVEIDGIDMIHIGLNDMHLALKMKFMFQLLTDGSVDKWTRIIAQKGIMYGFGGLASLNGGTVPGRMILKEHYRLGSQMVIGVDVEACGLCSKSLKALCYFLPHIACTHYSHLGSCHFAKSPVLGPAAAFLLLAEEPTLLIVL